MSQFSTTIPLPIDEILAKLPEGSWHHPTQAVRLSDDKRSIIIEWVHDQLVTPYSRAIEYPLAALSGQEPMPAEIRDAREFKRVQNQPIATTGRKVRKVAQ